MHSQGFGLATIRAPRVYSNIGDLKIFKSPLSISRVEGLTRYLGLTMKFTGK
ncbi:hypothetical protein GIB67_001717 [Kingdonia uniflora]|uniref:Uncharacterized protein n=1 Tax=Kingdonia uniflora TaxID=39325 RepID=A0A7J7LMR2_9MAGN|nr:hypothetical protein GIB67_001717 [Kingdonia uniflora]